MPWLGPIEALQAAQGELHPAQVHPLHVFWSTPRRIRLDFDETTAAACDVCAEHHDRCLTQYVTRNYGLNYKGPWRHPLSPYYKVKDDWLPVHPQPGGLGYRHWLGLTLGQDNDRRQILAAPVVAHFLADQERRLATSGLALRLWCFGHDMDNMKARCWHEATMPLYDLTQCSAAETQALRDDVRDWIGAAESVASLLRLAVKSAFFPDDGKTRDLSHVDAAFWSATEQGFHRALRDTIAAYRSGIAPDGIATREAWLKHLQAQALSLFDRDFVGAGLPAARNMARVAGAHLTLRRGLYGPKLRSALGLPVTVPDAAKGRSTGKSKARATPQPNRGAPA